MKARTIAGDELYLRCVFCGDSQRDTTKSHFSVNLKTGTYHCYRCNASGRLSTRFLLRLVEEAGFDPQASVGGEVDIDPREFEETLSPGPASDRGSLLDRYHVVFRDGLWDAFKMYDLSGEVIGILLRLTGGEKKAHIIGSRGLLIPRNSPCFSNEQAVLRVVEGPYDVLSKYDIGLSGFLSRTRLADLLPGRFVRLCPDGDIWTKPDHFRVFVMTVYGLYASKRGPWPTAIEFLPDGLDPDEVPISERVLIKPSTLIANARLKGFLAI